MMIWWWPDDTDHWWSYLSDDLNGAVFFDRPLCFTDNAPVQLNEMAGNVVSNVLSVFSFILNLRFTWQVIIDLVIIITTKIIAIIMVWPAFDDCFDMKCQFCQNFSALSSQQMAPKTDLLLMVSPVMMIMEEEKASDLGPDSINFNIFPTCGLPK